MEEQNLKSRLDEALSLIQWQMAIIKDMEDVLSQKNKIIQQLERINQLTEEVREVERNLLTIPHMN
jgi:L-lactate utilization protein LutB